jgi:hypothetical protein
MIIKRKNVEAKKSRSDDRFVVKSEMLTLAVCMPTKSVGK